MTLTKSTYTVYVTCTNCGRYGSVTLPTGRLIAEHPCDKCGCKTLRKR